MMLLEAFLAVTLLLAGAFLAGITYFIIVAQLFKIDLRDRRHCSHDNSKNNK